MGWTICGDTPRTRSVPIIKTPRSITWSIASSDTSKAFPQRKHDAKPAYYPMTSGSRKNVKFSLVTCLAYDEAEYQRNLDLFRTRAASRSELDKSEAARGV